MNRHGDKALITATVEKLREKVDGIVLRTTAMVGFPGETDEDFEELCEFVKKYKFDNFGAFTFSEEEGTEAVKLDGKVDEQTKQDRYDILMQTQLTATEENNEKKIGREYTVLCEGFDTVAEIHYGRSYENAPDVDGRIYFKSDEKIKEGEFCRVKITEAVDYDLVGIKIQ